MQKMSLNNNLNFMNFMILKLNLLVQRNININRENCVLRLSCTYITICSLFSFKQQRSILMYVYDIITPSSFPGQYQL